MTEETKRKISKANTSYKKGYNNMIVDFFENALSKRTPNGVVERVPSYAAFARRIGVTTRTIENWRKKYERFDDACKECDDMLRETICGDALTFKMHASFAKFLLSSRYGMREKVEITQEDAEVIVPDEIQEMIRLRKERGNA